MQSNKFGFEGRQLFTSELAFSNSPAWLG